MQQGHFARAFAVFQAILPLIDHPRERLYVEADLMRAAAGAGDARLARDLAATVRDRAERPELSSAAAPAFLELASGALQLQDWTLAEQLARRALQLATEHRQGKTRLTADSLLQAIEGGRSAAPPAPPAPPLPTSRGDTPSDSLAQEIVRSLRGMSTASR